MDKIIFSHHLNSEQIKGQRTFQNTDILEKSWYSLPGARRDIGK